MKGYMMFESKLAEDTNKVYNYILDLIEKNPDYTNINGSAWMGLPGYITFYGYDIQRATIWPKINQHTAGPPSPPERG